MTEYYLGIAAVARAAGFTPQRVRNWMARAEFPEPDVVIGEHYCGWLPERLPELVAWMTEYRAGLDETKMTWDRRRGR